MKEFTYVITDEDGMHARPAGMLVKEANLFQSSIQIGRAGKFVDGKRIFGIMSLGIGQGDEITLKIDGVDEVKAAGAIESFLKEHM